MLAKLARLSGGNAFAQLVNFIAISYVSRSVGPDEYGNYALIISLSLIITAFVTLKGDNIIYSCTKVQDLNEAIINLVGFISRSVFVLIIISAIVACFDIYLGGILLIALLLSLLNSVIVVASAYFIQEEKISSHLKLLLIRPTLMLLMQVVLIIVSKTYIFLCLGKMIADSLVALIRIKSTPAYHASASIASIKIFLVKYKYYCLHGTSASVLNIFNQQLALIASPFIYNGFYTGHLGLALSLVIAPIGIILSPLRGLVIKKVSQDKPTLKSYTLYTLLLGMLAIIGYIVAYLATPYIVSNVWGDTWPYLVEVVTCLIIWPLSSLFSSYSYAVIISNSKQRLLLSVEIIYLLIRATVISCYFLYSAEFMTYIVTIAIIGFTYNLIISLIGLREVIYDQ
ncbi:hypothetical protein [Cobetia marina]|uniref:hypothetical protein n=1 Tax=Cobetia marina TaxID=28258 RepID=UPI003A904401